jgi:hypothetical protein
VKKPGRVSSGLPADKLMEFALANGKAARQHPLGKLRDAALSRAYAFKKLAKSKRSEL